MCHLTSLPSKVFAFVIGVSIAITSTVSADEAGMRRFEIYNKWRHDAYFYYNRLSSSLAKETRQWIHPALSNITEEMLVDKFSKFRDVSDAALVGPDSMIALKNGLLTGEPDPEGGEYFAIYAPILYKYYKNKPAIVETLDHATGVTTITDNTKIRQDLWLYENGGWKVIPQEWLDTEGLLASIKWLPFVRRE